MERQARPVLEEVPQGLVQSRMESGDRWDGEEERSKLPCKKWRLDSKRRVRKGVQFQLGGTCLSGELPDIGMGTEGLMGVHTSSAVVLEIWA